MEGDSCEFESQMVNFSSLLVEKTENKQKDAGCGPFVPFFWSLLQPFLLHSVVDVIKLFFEEI